MKTILVLTNFSEKSKQAAEHALNIAFKVKANVLLCNALVESVHTERMYLSLTEFSRDLDRSQDQLMQLAGELTAKVSASDETFKPLVSYQSRAGRLGNLGCVVKEIVAKSNIWMIVMGANEDSSLSNFIYGSNALSVINYTTCPVLLIPSGGANAAIQQIVISSEQPEFEEEPVGFLEEFSEPFNSDIYESQISLINGRLTQIVKTVKQESATEARKKTTDILVLVYKKCDVFKKMFHSLTTNILINYPHKSLLVYPGSGA